MSSGGFEGDGLVGEAVLEGCQADVGVRFQGPVWVWVCRSFVDGLRREGERELS